MIRYEDIEAYIRGERPKREATTNAVLTAQEARELTSVGQVEECERIFNEILDEIRRRALSGYGWVIVYGYGFSGAYKRERDLSQLQINVMSRLRELGYRCDLHIRPWASLSPYHSWLAVSWEDA